MWRQTVSAGVVIFLVTAVSSQAQVLQFGLDGVAWETPNDTGPLLYREVAEADLVSVKAKISAQTAGFWSQAGIIARVPNPASDVTAGQEDWQAAWSFRANVGGPFDLQHNMATAGVESELATGGLNADQLTYVRLDNLGAGEFQAYWGEGEDDSIVWTPVVGTQTNANLVGQTLQVGIAGGAIGALPGAAAIYDWVEIDTTSDTYRDDFDYTRDFSVEGVPVGGIWTGVENASAGGLPMSAGDLGRCTVCDWSVNGSGDLNLTTNWLTSGTAETILIPPDSNDTTVVFGAASAAGPATVYTNENTTLKQIDFDNATNKYVLGGAGSITLASDGASAAINVLSGSHEIQADLILDADTTATAAAGTTLDINASIFLNGNTFTTAGAGVVNLNNGTVEVGGGAFVNSGSLMGLSSVSGDFSQTDGATLALLVDEGIEVDGDASLSGALSLAVPEGFELVVGESFTLLTANSVTANNLSLTGSAAGLFQLVVSGDSVSVVAIPEPGALLLAGIGIAAAAMRRRRLATVRRYAGVLPMALVALACTSVRADVLSVGPMDEPVTYRDDFDTFYDYYGGGGAAPTGTFTSSLGGTASWTGAHNQQNGGDPGLGVDAIFVANGADFEGTPKPGVLLIEDLAFHPNTDGTTGQIGFESNKNNSPYLYANVDAGDNFEATIKIDNQTAGFWSYSPIVARLSGPTVGLGNGDTLDATEAQVTAGSFRTTVDNPDTPEVDETLIANLLMQNVGDFNGDSALQEFEANVAGETGLPMYVRLSKQGSLFTSSTSLDGVTYTERASFVNELLSNPGDLLEIGPSFMMYSDVDFGQTEIDFFEITVSKLLVFTDATWDAAGSGNWNNGGNWASTTVPGMAPNANTVDVTLGGAVSGPTTVFNNEDVTIRSLTFASANKYAVSGAGSLTLAPYPESEVDTDATYISVESGSHEIQLPLALSSDAADDNHLLALSGSQLDINNSFDINGKTVYVEGGGTINLNNNIDTGTSGEVIVSEGTLGGSGRVNANLTSGDVVAPGTSVGTLTVDGDYTQDSTGTLAIELGGVGKSDLLDVLGLATLDGVLDVQFADGYFPTAGDIGTTWDVLTASSIDNALGIELDGSDASYFSLAVVGSVLELTLLGLPPEPLVGDYNEDGVVDAADYTVWRDLSGSAGSLPNRDPANSGPIGSDDYDSWVANYGSSSSASGGQPIPEPTSLVLAIALAGAAGVRRRSPGR